MYRRKMKKKHKAMSQNEAVWALGFECLNNRADKELYSHRIKTTMHIVIIRDFKHFTTINHALKWNSHSRKHTEKVAASSSLQLVYENCRHKENGGRRLYHSSRTWVKSLADWLTCSRIFLPTLRGKGLDWPK